MPDTSNNNDSLRVTTEELIAYYKSLQPTFSSEQEKTTYIENVTRAAAFARLAWEHADPTTGNDTDLKAQNRFLENLKQNGLLQGNYEILEVQSNDNLGFAGTAIRDNDRRIFNF